MTTLQTSRHVHIITLGCPKNLVDSEGMAALLPPPRYTITDRAETADIILINTCTFIESATQESIDTILSVAALKKSGRLTLLGVVGCLVQRYQAELRELLPEVDLFIGTSEWPRIAQILEAHAPGQAAQLHFKAPEAIEAIPTERPALEARHYAYVKISEGCSRSCSFCIIPKIKGQHQSRTPEFILREARQLASRGVKEINLIAQDLTAYGMDLGPGYSLTNLLKELVKIKEIPWLRLLYCYPNGIDRALLELMKNEAAICPYLDIPIQHSSDRILKKMRRGISARKTREILEMIKTVMPDIALRTTLIVGFPGETDQDFADLLDLVRWVEFDHLGAFTYSREENTPAYAMRPQIPDKVKAERYDLLMSLQQEISQKRLQRQIGQRQIVLVDGVENADSPLLIGRTRAQAPEIDGVTILDGVEAEAGDLVEVVIRSTMEYDLVATPPDED
jgi:ribosomal protein S12 methylthiotransferase